jgi:hypothetical protein
MPLEIIELIAGIIDAANSLGSTKPGAAESRTLRMAKKAWATAESTFEVLERASDGDSLTLVVDHTKVKVEKRFDWRVTLSAAAQAAKSWRLKVFPAGEPRWLSRVTSFENVETGDSAFDHAFVVRSPDADFARAWLNPTVRKHVRWASRYELTLDEGKVTATIDQPETSPRRLVAALRAVAAFCDGRQHVMREWRAAAKRYGAVVRTPHHRWARMTGELDGVSFSVEVQSSPASTNVYAQLGRAAVPTFTLATDPELFDKPASEDPRVPAGYHLWTHDATHVVRLLARVGFAGQGIASLTGSGQRVLVQLPGICADREALQRAIELAVRVVSDRDSPYR